MTCTEHRYNTFIKGKWVCSNCGQPEPRGNPVETAHFEFAAQIHKRYVEVYESVLKQALDYHKIVEPRYCKLVSHLSNPGRSALCYLGTELGVMETVFISNEIFITYKPYEKL